MTPLSSNFSRHLPRHLYALATGIAAGGIVGSVGWGGAQVLIPSLTANVSFAKYSQLSATGISLTSLSTSTVTSGWKFWREGQVDVQIALFVGIPAMLSARLGTLWAKKLSGNTLALIFNAMSIVLLPTHFWIQERAKMKRKIQSSEGVEVVEPIQTTTTLITGRASEPAARTITNNIYSSFQLENIQETSPKVLQFVAFGLFQGILSSLMGTTICAVIPSILTSAVSRIHAIPLGAAGAVCIGAIVGGYGGAKMALAMDDEQLRNLYMGSLLLFGGRSVVGAAKNMRQLLRKSGTS